MKKRIVLCLTILGLVSIFNGCGKNQENNLATPENGKETIGNEFADNDKMVDTQEKSENEQVVSEEILKEEKSEEQKEIVDGNVEEETVIQEEVTEEKREEQGKVESEEIHKQVAEEKMEGQEVIQEEKKNDLEKSESENSASENMDLGSKSYEQIIAADPGYYAEHLTPTQEALLQTGYYTVIENASHTGYAVMVPVEKSDYGYQILQEYLTAMDCEAKDLSGGMIDEEHYMCVALQIVPLVTMEDEEFWN